ncbi:MAG: zinc-binding dehydrogenase [Ignavibacteria bacterium]|nr:zinc-binding dehydrogenase [Ignavibacteria bacterium]
MYIQGDFTSNGETYDMILDVAGKSSYSRSLKSLRPNGRYILANPSGLLQVFRALWTSMISNLPGRHTGKKVIFEFANEKSEDLIFLRDLVEAGKIRAVIDRCYPLEQAAEAHRYIEGGHKKGNVVITLKGSIGT